MDDTILTRFRVDKPREDRDRVSHIADTNIQIKDDSLGLFEIGEKRKIYSERNGQLLCNRGSWLSIDQPKGLTIEEAAAEMGFAYPDLDEDSPENVCSYCWNQLLEEVEKSQEIKTSEHNYGEVGFRLRWKKKGDARKVWENIIVSPEATFEDLDTVLARTFGIDNFHLRMYGLEGEYDRSSLGILPKVMYEEAGHPSQQSADQVTITEVAEDYSLWEGDRLTLVYDLATPSERYYCIIKNVLTEEEISELRNTPDTEPESQSVFSLPKS